MVKVVCQIKPHKDSNIEISSNKKLQIHSDSKELYKYTYETEIEKVYEYNSKEIYDNEIKKNLYKNFGVFIYGDSKSNKKQILFGDDKTEGIFDLMSKNFEDSYEIEAINVCYNGTYDLFTGNKIVFFPNENKTNSYKAVKHQITPETINYYKKIIYDSRNIPTSHLILYIYKNGKKYHIVDLVKNELDLLESSIINDLQIIFIECSLITLKNYFSNLNNIHVSYDSSDLSMLLKNTNNYSLIICTIREGYEHFYESRDTLKYIDSLIINKSSTRNKVMSNSPKKVSFLKEKKNEIISDRKLLSPKKLFSSKSDLIKNDDRLSPKNINYNAFFNADMSPLKSSYLYDDLDELSLNSPINKTSSLSPINLSPPKLSSYYDELEKSLVSSLLDLSNSNYNSIESDSDESDSIKSDSIKSDSIKSDSIKSDSDESDSDNKYNIKLCKNEDCSAIKTNIFNNKCSICTGYFNKDGLNDIYFLNENNENGICSLCGKTKNICIMKSTYQYICVSACDSNEDEDEDEDEYEDDYESMYKFSSDGIKTTDSDSNLFDKNYNYDYGDDDVILSNSKEIISMEPQELIKTKLEVKSRKKLIGIINNLLYKKIVSNYKILLDDNLTNDDCDKLVINTAATLEVCMQELFKTH